MPTLTITRLFNSSGDRKFPIFFQTMAIFLEILSLVKVSILYPVQLKWEKSFYNTSQNSSLATTHRIIKAAL